MSAAVRCRLDDVCQNLRDDPRCSRRRRASSERILFLALDIPHGRYDFRVAGRVVDADYRLDLGHTPPFARAA